MFPFCGEASSEDYTAPGPWPFDHQCVIRFPEDLARRISQAVEADEKREHSDAPEALDLVITPLDPKSRRWEVRAFGERLQGTLVDLPRPVESHILQDPVKGDTDTTFHKSADITQLLIVHREPEPPGADVELNRKTFVWSSGLTPYTTRIANRSFRECPFDPKELHETEQALESWIRGESYKTTQKMEMTDKEVEELRRTQAENIWEPPSEPNPAEAATSVGGASTVSKDNETRVEAVRRKMPGRRLAFGSLSKKRLRLNVGAPRLTVFGKSEAGWY